MRTDPIVEEVRRARYEHAARFDFDMRRIVADIQERERLSSAHFVTLPPKPPRIMSPTIPADTMLVSDSGDEARYEA